MTHQRIFVMSNTKAVTSAVTSGYPSGEPKILVWVRFSDSLLFGGKKYHTAGLPC